MSRKKRSNGEGTFYQKKDRTWVLQITLGRNEAGTLQRKSFTAKTKTLCIERKNQWLAEQEAHTQLAEAQRLKEEEDAALRLQLGHSVESEILFSDAFMSWLQLYKSPPTRKPSTYASYIDIYEGHFKPFFGEMSLYNITQDTVQDYYQKKQLSGSRNDGKAGGLSPKSIRNHHMLLKDFFSYALGKYKLDVNPALETERPEVITKEMRVLSSSEMEVFISEVMKETQRVAILTDLMTGLRIGELLALEITDLDLNKQTLSVTKDLIRVKTSALSLNDPNIRILNYDPAKKTHLIVQNKPKTKKSVRTIAISDELAELLIRHLYTMAYSFTRNPDNLLFPSAVGTHLDPKSFEIRLSAVSKRCGIQKVNPHALRHTLATRLVEERIPLNIVQGIMGHASIETTRKYLHKDDEIEREAIATMSNMINMDTMTTAPNLNGARKKHKFANLPLPDFAKQSVIHPESA